MAKGIVFGAEAARQLMTMYRDYYRDYRNAPPATRRQPVIQASVGVIWGTLMEDLINDGEVLMRVEKHNKYGGWSIVEPDLLVSVTARNIPDGKAIPAGSPVGASPVGDGIYCVLVSDCPVPIGSSSSGSSG